MGKYLVKVKKDVKKEKKEKKEKSDNDSQSEVEIVQEREALMEDLDFDTQLKMILNTKEKEPEIKQQSQILKKVEIQTKSQSVEIKPAPLHGRSKAPIGTRGGSVSSRRTY